MRWQLSEWTTSHASELHDGASIAHGGFSAAPAGTRTGNMPAPNPQEQRDEAARGGMGSEVVVRPSQPQTTSAPVRQQSRRSLCTSGSGMPVVAWTGPMTTGHDLAGIGESSVAPAPTGSLAPSPVSCGPRLGETCHQRSPVRQISANIPPGQFSVSVACSPTLVARSSTAVLNERSAPGVERRTSPVTFAVSPPGTVQPPHPGALANPGAIGHPAATAAASPAQAQSLAHAHNATCFGGPGPNDLKKAAPSVRRFVSGPVGPLSPRVDVITAPPHGCAAMSQRMVR